jgi:hypothetical protein
MKKSLIILVLIALATVYAGAYIEFFHARSESDDVKLEWKTVEENNVSHFSILRKTPQSPYIEIASVQPKGNNSYYTYVDQNAYKANDILFTYQIKIVDKNGQVASIEEASVSHNISGVKRTWGSIKAMFR